MNLDEIGRDSFESLLFFGASHRSLRCSLRQLKAFLKRTDRHLKYMQIQADDYLLEYRLE